MKLEEFVGERLVIGIPGTKITPEIVRHFKELHAGGLILYRINFDSPPQIKKLIADLEEALGRKLLVTADHEGGRVIMFRDGITVFPDNLAVGTAGKIDYARQQGEIEAQRTEKTGAGCESGAGARCFDRGLQPEYRDTFLRQRLEIGGGDGRGADCRHATGRTFSLRQAFSRQGSCTRRCPSWTAGHPAPPGKRWKRCICSLS